MSLLSERTTIQELSDFDLSFGLYPGWYRGRRFCIAMSCGRWHFYEEAVIRPRERPHSTGEHLYDFYCV